MKEKLKLKNINYLFVFQIYTLFVKYKETKRKEKNTKCYLHAIFFFVKRIIKKNNKTNSLSFILVA